MRAPSIVRSTIALAFLLLGPPAVLAADPCLCTPRVDFRSADGQHDWFVTADSSGALKVTLVLGVIADNMGHVSGDQLNATISDPDGAIVGVIALSYPSGTAANTWIRGDASVPATAPGEVYRVRVFRAVPHPTFNHFSRYWLRIDGGSDAAIDGPLQSLNGGRTTWTFHADAGDAMGVRLYDPSTYPIEPGSYPVMYQWIAPDGTAQPIGSYTVAGPGMDTMIPPPSGLVSGTWQLRLQSLSFTNVGWSYGIEKTTGTDRRLHVEPGLAGLAYGGRITFVDQFGAPFTDAVDFTFGFGESFTFPLPGGVFETTNDTDVFPIPITITPAAGLTATPSAFFFLPPCDGFFEQVVVIAPPPAEPPTLTVALSPAELWPPNHTMRTVEASIDVSHADLVELVSITSNEPGVDADVSGATFGTDDRVFQLRAERLGNGGGRVYTITYRATDTTSGSSTLVSATVAVPHDQGKK